MNHKRNIIKEHLPAIIAITVIFVIWFTAAELINAKNIFPSPVDIIIKIWELREPLFLHHLPATMLTFAAGWSIAILVGVTLAVLMRFSEYAKAMLFPAMTVTQGVPVMCISPLLVLWLGYTIRARLLVVVLSTFFVIALNTYKGLKSVSIKKRDWLYTCGANKIQVFSFLEIPSALPDFFTALKLTLPWALIDAAVAEWLGATEGLGYLSKRMVSKLDGAAVLAPIMILSIIALVGMAVLKHIDHKYIAWRNEV